MSCMSDSSHQVLASVMTLGTPGVRCVKRLLLMATTKPMADCKAGRPISIFVAHRYAEAFQLSLASPDAIEIQ